MRTLYWALADDIKAANLGGNFEVLTLNKKQTINKDFFGYTHLPPNLGICARILCGKLCHLKLLYSLHPSGFWHVYTTCTVHMEENFCNWCIIGFFLVDTLKDLWLVNLLPGERKLRCFREVLYQEIFACLNAA